MKTYCCFSIRTKYLPNLTHTILLQDKNIWIYSKSYFRRIMHTDMKSDMVLCVTEKVSTVFPQHQKHVSSNAKIQTSNNACGGFCPLWDSFIFHFCFLFTALLHLFSFTFQCTSTVYLTCNINTHTQKKYFIHKEHYEGGTHNYYCK